MKTVLQYTVLEVCLTNIKLSAGNKTHLDTQERSLKKGEVLSAKNFQFSKCHTPHLHSSEFQKVGDNSSVVDQVRDVTHGSLWSHLWVMMMVVVVVVSLALSYLPVHWLRVGRDHLVYRGLTSTSSTPAVHALMSPRRSQALGLEVPEGLVGAGGG